MCREARNRIKINFPKGKYDIFLFLEISSQELSFDRYSILLKFSVIRSWIVLYFNPFFPLFRFSRNLERNSFLETKYVFFFFFMKIVKEIKLNFSLLSIPERRNPFVCDKVKVTYAFNFGTFLSISTLGTRDSLVISCMVFNEFL